MQVLHFKFTDLQIKFILLQIKFTLLHIKYFCINILFKKTSNVNWPVGNKELY